MSLIDKARMEAIKFTHITEQHIEQIVGERLANFEATLAKEAANLHELLSMRGMDINGIEAEIENAAHVVDQLIARIRALKSFEPDLMNATKPVQQVPEPPPVDVAD